MALLRGSPGALALALLLGAPAFAAEARLRILARQPGLSEPVAVRAVVRQSNGEILPGEWGDSTWPAVSIRGKAVTPEMLLTVPLGETTLTLGKGPEFLPVTIRTNLAEARTYVLNVDLQPALNLFERGWRAGDAHVHFFHGDGQVFRTPEEAYAICAAAGLNFVSFAGEHFGAPTLERADAERTWRPYQTGECRLWLGAEAPKNAWGHHASIVYDPWTIKDALPYQHGIYEVHRQGGVCFPVHPERTYPFRSFDGDPALFPLHNYHKFYPIAALSGHLLDGWSGVSDEPLGRTKLPPYLKLLELGWKIPLLADSDFCMDRLNNGPKGAGFWMNYFHLEGRDLSRASVAEAIRKGRVMSTTGPLVLFQVDDAISGDILPADGAERTIRIQAAYRFNPWTLSSRNFADSEPCRIDAIDLIRNGEVVRTWQPGGPVADVTHSISETEEAYYMGRVTGNESVWMAAYASPVYFSRAADPPRRPESFKMLVNGRLYDARTGAPLPGSVSSVRYGKVDWTISTDSNGLFRALVPIDAELRARDSQGRELARDLLNHEPAYAFCHYLPERYTNKAEAIAPFQALLREVNWEFPIGLQLADSYVRTPLLGDVLLDDAALIDAPPAFPGKDHAEIAMIIFDKTQVAPGDTLNCSFIYRLPPGSSNHAQIGATLSGWDPAQPRVYTRYGRRIDPAPRPAPPVELGSGFFLQALSFPVPPWVANWTDSANGLRLSIAVMKGFEVLEDANFNLRIGPTRRELLVSSTWDGFPASWGDRGRGPANFYREAFKARFADHRRMTIRAKVEGARLRISPLDDTAHCADADDALFTDQFYYDGQCEPGYRNIPFRDPVRPQPAPPSFAGLPVDDPTDTTPPEVPLLEPLPGAVLPSPVNFYFHVEDAGLSGPAHATLLIDGAPLATNITPGAITVPLPEGEHTWSVEAWDRAGNHAASATRTFTVQNQRHETAPRLLAPQILNGNFAFRFQAAPGANLLIERADRLDDWRLLLRTNVSSPTTTILDRPLDSVSLYRLRSIK